MLLGEGGPCGLKQMSGEIWPVRRLAEIVPALGVPAEAVGWISSKQAEMDRWFRARRLDDTGQARDQ